MFQKFGFHLKQAFYNVKKSTMTIITLALAISMIAGLFFYFDAFERQALRSSSEFDMFTDLDLIHSTSIQSINCTDAFDSTDYQVYRGTAIADLEIESVFKYQAIYSEHAFLYKDYSSYPEKQAMGLQSLEYLKFHSYQFNDAFYESSRFTNFFRMMNGTTPQNKDEIIIDMIAAAKLDVTVNSTTTLNSWYRHSYYDVFLLNLTVKITGIFIPKTALPTYRIINESLRYENFYLDMTEEEISDLEVDDLYDISTIGYYTPVFGYSNFTQNDHPFQDYYKTIESFTGESSPRIWPFSGYGVTINRDFSSFFSMLPPDQTVKVGVNTLRRNIPYQIIVIDMLSVPLQELFETSNRLRIISQIINLPILLVAIIVGSFASRSSTQDKIDEFLLLRSKGASKQMVRRQILMEAVVNGVVASVLGTGLGFVAFFGHDIWIRPMIYTQFIELDLSLYAKQSSILLSIILGILLSIITSFSSMKYVSSLNTSELLTAIEQQEMDIEFDEQTVFKTLNREKTDTKERKREYKSIVEEKRKKVAKWSILLFIIGLLPIYYYTFLVFAERYGTKYWIRAWVEAAKNYTINGFSTFLFIATPILLVIGLIRIVTIEAPVLFGRMSNFLGRLFVGRKSYLLGLQMMKKKQYSTVILLLSIFTSVFVHLNVMTYTGHAQENLYTNFQIGSDIKVNFGYDGVNVTNTGDFKELIQDLETITKDGTKVVEEAMITYEHRSGALPHLYQHYIDFDKYLNLVLDGNKIIPNNNFISSIMELIDYRLTDPYGDGIPGAIVNHKYLEDTLQNIGDITFIDYRYYDSRLPLNTAFQDGSFEIFRIVAVADYFPGVYAQYINVNPSGALAPNAPLEHIVVDAGDLPRSGMDYILHAPNLRMLININEDVEKEIDDMEHFLSLRTETDFRAFSRGDFQFYIDKEVSLQHHESNQINPLLVYKIGYLIFIVVLIQVSLGLPILLSSVRRKEQHFYGILMSRGMGKRGVFRFMLGELFIIYAFAIIGGLGVGLLSSTLTLFFGKNSNPYNFGQQFRIFANPVDLAVILGSVIGVSLIIFVVGFLYETRKSISEYLYKF